MNFNKAFFIIGLTGILLSGCANTQKKEDQSLSAQENAAKPVNDSVIYPSDSDTIRIQLRDGKGALKIHKEERQYVNVMFDSHGFTKMTATLSSGDSTANIRFGQIIMPNGNMDGPFGPTMSYDLPVEGDYVLSIHENQMAGDPWSGDFEVSISLEK